MKITPIKTKIIDPINPPSIYSIIDQYIKRINDRSIIAITSKIVAICEKHIYDLNKTTKDEAVIKEADLFLPASYSQYNVVLSIKNNTLIPSAGIDQSNSNGYLIPWPKDPQKSANRIRKHLQKKFPRKKIGIIITDSTVTPLKWGTTGISIAHSGFKALKNYVGQPDIFQQDMQITQANHANALAAAAVLTMGEGNEQTPIAIIEEIPFVKFQDRNPTNQELQSLIIKPEDDLYAPILTKVKWKKGK